MAPTFLRSFFVLLIVALLLPYRLLPQQRGATSSNPVGAYPDTSQGLQELLEEIVNAAAANDSVRETELIHGFLLPKNSTWFTDEYGPGFGASLAAAYRRVEPDLEQVVKTMYDGNAERRWLTATVRRYVDPNTERAPDKFLNCMEHIVPLYRATFKDGSVYYSQKPGENSKEVAGDPSGYFIYDQRGFRFIPTTVLQKLPKQRQCELSWT